MVIKQGSINNAPENSFYTDLVLTRYPEFYDERAGVKQNINLFRQTNLEDYNMAEHVNAVQDAIMAIQRALGEMVQVPANPTRTDGTPITDPVELRNLALVNTVKDRLNAIERYDWYTTLDKRYGGPNWSYDETKTNATIQQHKHLGSASGIPGTPEKISLTAEVTGVLPKANINLTKTASGITGSDIYVEATSPKKIADALNDTISEETGGTISQVATLQVLGKTNTRWTREFDANDATGTVQQDAKTLLNKAVESPATTASTLLSKPLTGMHHGRYVAIVRVSTSSLTTSPVVEIVAQNSVTNATLNSIQLVGTEFDQADKYKSFYLIFEHEGATNLVVRKLNTSTSAKIRFDYAIVEPVHPAVFDR